MEQSRLGGAAPPGRKEEVAGPPLARGDPLAAMQEVYKELRGLQERYIPLTKRKSKKRKSKKQKSKKQKSKKQKSKKQKSKKQKALSRGL